MSNISSKIIEEDLILLGLLDKKEKPQIRRKRSFIHIPIDRRFIGMTQKERNSVTKVSKRN
jgi:hypothetical protein